MNLALSFGLERENSVCLLDADLRTPRVQKAFPAGPVGLAEVLEGDAKLDEALVAVPETRLMVLPVKALPSAPSELLSAHAMVDLLAELSTRFQTVIVDAPPVLGLPDTVTLVDLCDAALFVVGAGRSPREDVEAALSRLDANKLIGVVLNRCDRAEVSYLGSYGYGSGRVEGGSRADMAVFAAILIVPWLLALVLTPATIRFASARTCWTGRPSARRTAPVAILGGVAVFAAIVLGVGLLTQFVPALRELAIGRGSLGALALGCGLMVGARSLGRPVRHARAAQVRGSGRDRGADLRAGLPGGGRRAPVGFDLSAALPVSFVVTVVWIVVSPTRST